MNTPSSIIYLHGFASSPESEKGKLLSARLDKQGLAAHFHAPYLPPNPLQAIEVVESMLLQLVKSHTVTLVGSSLGGFYATYCAARYGLKAALINPAIYPWRHLPAYIGPYFEAYTQTHHQITMADADVLKSLATIDLSKIPEILLLLQTGDEIFDYQEALTKYPHAQQYVQQGGNHRFADFATVVPLILKFAGFASPESAIPARNS